MIHAFSLKKSFKVFKKPLEFLQNLKPDTRGDFSMIPKRLQLFTLYNFAITINLIEELEACNQEIEA